AKYVRLNIKGNYQGVYLDIERVDKNFLAPNEFVDLDASIYRCGNHDCEMKTWRMPYQGKWEKKNNEEEPNRELDALLRIINFTPEPELARQLEARLQLEFYLRSMTMDALMSNNIIEDSQSYLIHDRVTGMWTYVPWDLNNGDARWWPTYPVDMKPVTDSPLFPFTLGGGSIDWMYERRRKSYPDYVPAFSNLNTRIAWNPELRGRLDRLIRRAVDELFNPKVMNPHIDAIHRLLTPHVADDPHVDKQKFALGADFMKRFVAQRGSHVLAELDRWNRRTPKVQLAALDPHEGWIELSNPHPHPVDLGGLVLTTDLRRALNRNVPAQQLAPGEKVRFSAAQLGVTLGLEGEIGVFDGNTVNGVIDLLYYGSIPSGTRYVRNPAAASGWEVR
ncbi:MAG: CotH kinase family protein, partial [Myxococcales bacterium]